MIDGVVTPETELVTLVPGAGVEARERHLALDELDQRHPAVDVEVVDGGQRPARWIVGAE